MRCPKCGYISFDHLEQCLKCKKDISAVSDTMHGTVFNVAAPSFLRLSTKQDEDSEINDVFVDDLGSEDEFIDEDLEVLVEDEVLTESDTGVDAAALRRGGDTPVDDEDLQDREIEIDLSQFEDNDDHKGAPAEIKNFQKEHVVAPLTLDLPTELDDLSDLAPPSRATQAEKSEPKPVTQRAVAGSGMDDLDFDLGLGDLGADLADDGSDPAKETMLALDDIDFSETLTKSRAKPSGRSSGTDMDEDLNFDLDLGGLSIHKDL